MRKCKNCRKPLPKSSGIPIDSITAPRYNPKGLPKIDLKSPAKKTPRKGIR